MLASYHILSAINKRDQKAGAKRQAGKLRRPEPDQEFDDNEFIDGL